MTEKEKEKALADFDEAAKSGRVIIVERNDGPIGFATFKHKGDKILVNYCFIYKAFRNTCNLMGLRSFFRSKFNTRFVWHSRRRNRMVSVK